VRRIPLIVLAALIVWLTLAAGCRREHQHRYPPDVVANFMRACQVRASEKSCHCALAAMEARYTVDEYNAIEAGIRAGTKPPQEFVDIARDCGS
jgi:hypothetical protein